MTHTLTVAADSLSSGYVYKFKFRAINQIVNSQDSSVSQFALADQPLAPGVPTVMQSLTSDSQISLQWTKSSDTQSPGGDVTGYIVEMQDPDVGVFYEIYNGEHGFPDVTSLIVKTNITAGKDYRFRVKAAYLNGYSDYSSPDAIIYSCTYPSSPNEP